MEWEHTYCRWNGLEFIIQYAKDDLGDKLLFDIDYKGELFILDLGDRLEVA